MFSKFRDLLWPLGATVLALFVVPVAIEQYPEVFKESPWILPLSIGFVCLCWIIPLLVHHRVKRIHGWILEKLGTQWGWIVIVVISLSLIGTIGAFGYKLYDKHTRHLEARLKQTKSPVEAMKVEIKPQPSIVEPTPHVVPKPAKSPPARTKSDATSSKPSDASTEKGFHEKIESVTVFIGEGGMADTEPVGRLRSGPYRPFNFNGSAPITLSMDGDKINTDVTIGATPLGPALEIHNNEFTVRNPALDRNFNDKALEIVNSDHRVLLQVYWKTPSQLVINGIFPNGRRYILAGPGGAQESPTVLDTFVLKPIFKYPSWKHKGEYAEP